MARHVEDRRWPTKPHVVLTLLAMLMMGIPMAVNLSRGGFMRDFRGPAWAGAMMAAGAVLWLLNRFVWNMRQRREMRS